MTPEEQRDWLALVLVPGLGPVKIQQLRERLGEPGIICQSSDKALLEAGLSEKQRQSLRTPDEKRLQHSLNWLAESESHQLLAITDPAYPELLKAITDPPQILFAKGDISLLNSLQMAIVGSRNPTRNGNETAFQFARHLAQTGFTITSGLALGIDAASHRGALDAQGQTIAVAGNGLDRVYPARHHQLAHQIVHSGLLISEYLPGSKPLPQNFPRRNRIISGLSLGTLVIEAAQKSGSLITAYKALEQSREVFAIPGSIHNPLARGCHQLIREGAKLVESAQDILEELGPLAQANITLNEQVEPRLAHQQNEGASDETHQQILDAMAYDPINIDILIQRTGLPANILSSILLILELENKITSEAGGHYVRNSQT